MGHGDDNKNAVLPFYFHLSFQNKLFQNKQKLLNEIRSLKKVIRIEACRPAKDVHHHLDAHPCPFPQQQPLQ